MRRESSSTDYLIKEVRKVRQSAVVALIVVCLASRDGGAETPTPPTYYDVPIASFAATDNRGVTGYLITTSSTPPSLGAPGWSATPPKTTKAVEGVNTFYAWARDAKGNISDPASATCLVKRLQNATVRVEYPYIAPGWSFQLSP